MSLNPKQFRQQRLFNPLSVPRKQPHQMGLDEFAHSPRTMWHGSEVKDFNNLRPESSGFDTDQERQGFHVGTLGAAEDRMQISKRRAGYYHPVRINTFMDNTPQEPYHDQGDNWNYNHHNSYYSNAYEDVGSVSAILSSPHDVKTYGDHVAEALADPKKIPSGEAQWRHETGRTSFQRQGEVSVEKTSEVVGREPLTEGHLRTGLAPRVRYGREMKFADPRTGTDVNDPPMPPGFRGQQGFMFEGPGTSAPKVRPELISRGQFKG